MTSEDKSRISIRQAYPGLEDDTVISENYVAMMADMGFPEDQMLPDSVERCLDFIKEQRASYEYAAFIAESQGKQVGSAACHLQHGLWPLTFGPGWYVCI